MAERYSLSNTEKEIMRVLWDSEEKYTTKELLELFNDRGKEWKRQTLNTLLVRLEDKGLIMRDRRIVTVTCSEIEYRKGESNDILHNRYQGSISDFISALTGKKSISEVEEKKLNDLIDELKKK